MLRQSVSGRFCCVELQVESWVALRDVAGGVLKALEEQRQAVSTVAAASLPHHNDNEIRGVAPIRRALNE